MLLVAFLTLLCQFASAYDFSVDYTFNTGDIDATPRDLTVTLYYIINADGNSVSVTKGDRAYSDGVVFIPSSVEHDGKTYTVTGIGYNAFSSSSCWYVKMPDTVTRLEEKCFFEAKRLKQIEFSHNIETIGANAFQYCESLISIELHEGVKSIGEEGFSYCEKVTNLVLPSTLESIGTSCFQFLHSITSVVIPEKIKSIPSNCFYGCEKLKTVSLPEGLESIGFRTFSSTGIETINIPPTLQYIDEDAFSGTNVKNIVLPEGLTYLGPRAFSGCNQLESISFPSTLTTIKNGTCQSCTKLKNVEIANGVKVLGENSVNAGVFTGCTSLTSVDLPKSIESIGPSAFRESGLVSFTFPSWINTYDNYLLEKCKDLQEVIMGDNVTSIGWALFYECSSLRNVRLSESLKELPYDTFKGCTSLETINLPQSLEKIGSNCFEGTVNLTAEIIIPKNVTGIEYRAFSSSGIKKITIPHTTRYIGEYALTTSLEEAHVQRAIPPTAVGDRIIGSSNTTILYVPTGSAETYKNTSGWNVFSQIVEEDVPDVYYQLSYETKEGKGSVTVNGETISNGKTELLLNSGAVVKFIPEDTGKASTSYLLDHVVLNDKDITKELVDNSYTIEKVETNYNFEAYYRTMPLTLHVLNGNGGSVDIDVEKGKKVTFTVTSDEEWTVSSVYYNGKECTQDVLDGNKLTTPAINDNATISVTYQQVSGITENRIPASSMKAYGSSDGTIHVVGAAPQSRIIVCDVDGRVITAVPASSGETTINVAPGNVYILKNVNTALKLAL